MKIEKNEIEQLWQSIETTVNEIVEYQRLELLKTGRRFVPTLTTEDVLQPNDYAELEYNPHFRFEEGQLLGAQSIQMALLALKKESHFFEVIDT